MNFIAEFFGRTVCGQKRIKPFVIMKISLTMVMMTSIFLQISIGADGQSISLHERNAKLKDVLKKIRKQSGINFIYLGDVLQHTNPVNIVARKRPVQEVLEETFKDQPITYRLKNGTIILQRKTASGQAELVEIKLADIKGKVVDVNAEPLAGASIKVKGQDISTSTDVDGNFSLAGLPQAAVLIVSYIGYETQELAAISTAPMTITLVAVDSELGEVVVVGYGTQKKSELIGSVSQVNAKDINNRPVSSLSHALTGQMPGVTVIQRSGQPGSAGGSIQIRGVGSFGANPAALIMVDGIPVNSFNDVDPNDVESISVLKDASSAAIYGARAANGVILVTTKMGKSVDGKINVSYNGYVGSQRATAYPEYVDSWEYATLMNEAEPGSYTEEEIMKFRDGSDPENYPNENYVKNVFKKSSLQTAHNLSISNNSGSTSYMLSTGYLYQNGIVTKNNYSRYNLRFNMTNHFSKKVTLTTRLSGAQYLDNQPAPPATMDWNDMLGNISNVVRVPAIYVNRLSNGDYGLGVVGKGTPVSYFDNDSFYKNRETDLLANLKLDWELIQGLKFSIIGGYTQFSGNSQRFLANQRLTSLITLGPGALSQGSIQNMYKTFQQLLEYKANFNRHDLGVLVGHSYEYFRNSSFSGTRTGYFTNTLTELDAGDAQNQRNNGTAAETALDSYFSRVNYSYANKYLAEFVVRYDGSSRFPPNLKYATFPGGAIGWRISEESFLKNKIAWLSDLKFKASYGTLGNQNIGNYPYQDVLSPGFNYPIGGTITTGVANIVLVDPTITWESTRTKDIGVEASFFKGKLGFGANYFDRYTYDILVSPGASVSTVLGFGVGVRNSGELSNRGWEFTLDYRNRIGNLGYGLNGNFSVINNKVLSLGVGNINQPNGLVGNGGSLFNGYPMSIYYGYQTEGLFADAESIANYADQTAVNRTVRPGDIRYKDISGPDGVPDGKVDAVYDRLVLGSQIPKYTFGINISLDYKSFDFSLLLQGVSGVQGYLNNYAGWAFYQNGNIQRYQADSHWSRSNPDPNALYPRLEVIPNTGTGNTLTSSFWMLDGSYLKVRNIQLGYKLASRPLEDRGIAGIRIYATGQNPLVFSKYPQGWDPEINTGGSYYPILAVYTLGINVNF